MIGHCIHALHRVATRNANAGFYNRHTRASLLTNTWLFCWVVPTVVGRNVPQQRGRTVVERYRAALVYNRAPSAAAHTQHVSCLAHTCA